MANLYLILSNFSKFHQDMGKTLYANSHALNEKGFQLQSVFSNIWQINTLDPLATRFSNFWNVRHGEAAAKVLEHAKKVINDFILGQASLADPDKDLLWFTGPMHIESLQYLKNELSEIPNLSNRAIKPILILEPQSKFLMERIKLLWKQEKFPWISEEMLSPGAFENYFDLYDNIGQLFGKDNIELLPVNAQTELRGALTGLENILSLPPGILVEENFPYPETYAGLDITKSVFQFPFTKKGVISIDRQEFYKKLLEVENERQFERVNGVLPQAKAYGERFLEQNKRLAASLGLENLFTESDAPVLSEALPTLEKDQAEAFAARLDASERQAFLRYFRDREDLLDEEELIFAKGLEDSRRKTYPVSSFTFPRPEPLLTVLTMTRNHKDFILDCLESVSAQKVDFPIEHILVDDASNDGTQDIIDNYASTHSHVRPIYLPTRNISGSNIRTLFEGCKSEYAALCDGDDYFTDPLKLQKQLDFLRKNTDCSLCFHYVEARYEDNSQKPFIYPGASALHRGVREKYYLGDLLHGNFIQTNSVVYRWRFRDGLPDWFRTDLCPSDWYWHLLHAEVGKIGFIQEIMSVYRRHPASLYAQSFQATSREHRRRHGYRELKTFDAVNAHFNDRYFNSIAKLADGVFSDFCQIMIDEDNSDLLNEAVDAYPKFGLHFLQELDKVQKSHPKAE